MPAHSQTSTAAIVAAGRRLLETRGVEALTMRDVADAVGVRAPSLYKRVRGRGDLVRLILEDVADELTAALDAAAGFGDPVADVRAMAAAYRAFARSNPVAYTLMYAPQPVPGATARSVRSSATLLRVVTELAGPSTRFRPRARSWPGRTASSRWSWRGRSGSVATSRRPGSSASTGSWRRCVPPADPRSRRSAYAARRTRVQRVT